MDFLGTSWSRDEEQNLENLAAAGQRKNLSHVGADPFEVLWRLNDPDQS